jgi:hypothetical protein
MIFLIQKFTFGSCQADKIVALFKVRIIYYVLCNIAILYQRCNIRKCNYYTFIKTCDIIVCTHVLYLKCDCGCYGFNCTYKNVDLSLDNGNNFIIYTYVKLELQTTPPWYVF